MNQIKIGRFIADERKRKGYTQKQLSEKLEISDKTIFHYSLLQLPILLCNYDFSF